MVRIGFVLSALLALTACAAPSSPTTGTADPVAQTSVAPPQRVTAVSKALGQRLDSMLANAGYASSNVSR